MMYFFNTFGQISFKQSEEYCLRNKNRKLLLKKLYHYVYIIMSQQLISLLLVYRKFYNFVKSSLGNFGTFQQIKIYSFCRGSATKTFQTKIYSQQFFRQFVKTSNLFNFQIKLYQKQLVLIFTSLRDFSRHTQD